MKISGSNHIDIQKFKALLSYWVIHNSQHMKDIEKWLLKIEKLNNNYINKKLRIVIHLFKKINKEVVIICTFLLTSLIQPEKN